MLDLLELAQVSWRLDWSINFYKVHTQRDVFGFQTRWGNVQTSLWLVSGM